MKNILFSLLVVPLFLYGCSDDNENCTLSDPDEIQLQAIVESPVLRSGLGPLNSGFTTNFPIGVYAYNTAWQAGSSANVINNDAATVSGSAGHSVTFGGGPYYYPENGSTLHFFAYAPYGTETTAAGAGTSPYVNIPITGKDDVMWSTATGYKNGTAPNLNFQHMLTQLQFTFKADAAYQSGSVVTSLLVKAQPNSVNMNVGTGACTYSGSADMQALSSGDQVSGISISSAGTNANSPVITAPASGASAYVLSITVKPGGSSLTVTYDVNVNLTSVVGSAHMITLTFTRTAITATATVSNWLTGDTSDITVL